MGVVFLLGSFRLGVVGLSEVVFFGLVFWSGG